MVLKLISATPSPFARINRIALHEKSIPFELLDEVPWDSTTKTPTYNPLEKLPVLIFDDGRAPIYDSAFIQNYITEKYASHGPSLLPESLDDKLAARQIQVLAEGIMDAVALNFFEQARGEKMSQEWFARQNRKISGGMKALGEMARGCSEKGDEYLIANTYSIADIAAGCAVAFVDFVTEHGEFGTDGDAKEWKTRYPELLKYWERLEGKKTWKDSKPMMFSIQDKIV